MLDGAGSGVACAQRDELSHDAEQRYHGKRCVCVGCDSFYLKLDSFSLYKCTGQWVVSFFTYRKLSGFVGRCILVYIDSRSTVFVWILHMPAPYKVTLKEKVFLFYLFASS